MELRRFTTSFILLISLFISGCGFLSDAPNEDAQKFKVDLSSGCELNADNLTSDFFENDIEAQIKCFEQSLFRAFRDLNTQNDGVITSDELRAAINTLYRDRAQSILKGINVLFKINMLFLRDNQDQLSRDNVKPLFRILVEFNRKSIAITKILQGLDIDNYKRRRGLILQAFKSLSTTITSLINSVGKMERNLNIPNFLKEIRNDFDLDELDDNMIDYLVFAKKLFVGGYRNTINTDELVNFIEKMPLITINSFDYFFELEKTLKLLSDSEKDKYFEIRKNLREKLESISKQTQVLIHPDQSGPASVDLSSVLDKAIKTVKQDKLDPDQIKSALFMKKLFVGGQKYMLSTKEVDRLVDISTDLTIAVMDISLLRTKHFSNEAEWLEHMLGTFDIIESRVFPHNKITHIVSNQDLTNLINAVLGDDASKYDFYSSLTSLKTKFFKGSNPNHYTFGNIKTIFEKSRYLLKKSVFNSLAYEHFSESMKAPHYIGSLNWKEFKPSFLEKLTPKEVEELKNNFSHFVSNYRFFRSNETGQSIYAVEIHRNSYGVQELSLLHWLARGFVKVYGEKINDKRYFSESSLKRIFLDIKPFLQAFDMWTKDFSTFARNIVLLSDLFQIQSSGDLVLSTDELTEFGSLILGGMSLTNKIMDQMKVYCDPGTDEDKPEYDVICNRKHFFKVLFEDLKAEKTYPQLYAYVQSVDLAEQMEFVKGIEGFARDVYDEKIPMTSRDMTKVIGAMLNIESTLIRFDQNRDNEVANAELKVALKLYKNAILKLSEKQIPQTFPFTSDFIQKHLAKAIFYYLIDKKVIPDSPFKLLRHYSFRNRDEIIAKRINISKILFNLIMLADSQEKLHK